MGLGWKLAAMYMQHLSYTRGISKCSEKSFRTRFKTVTMPRLQNGHRCFFYSKMERERCCVKTERMTRREITKDGGLRFRGSFDFLSLVERVGEVRGG